MPQIRSQNKETQTNYQHRILMSSAGGAVQSVDNNIASNTKLLKGSKSRRYNSRNRNKNSRRNRGEMKLLGKYLDELRRNKSFDDLQTESEFEKVFAEGGVKIGKNIMN